VWLAGAEAARAASLRYTKRRTEYLVARWTAKQALVRALGLDSGLKALARIEVGHASTGAPAARLGGRAIDVAISLTDRAGWAVCVVGPRAGGRIGCDLELVEPRTAAFIRDYFTADERRFVAAAPDGTERDRRANLVWSAKESALKVLQTGLRRDTRSVEVTICLDRTPGGWVPLTACAAEGRLFPGWWAQFGTFLLTVAAEPGEPGRPTRPPVGLEEPPALAAATPVHSWLAHPAHPAHPA
jgi:4'-phosphopantetheinyl transferase